jgi:tripartite-type tricarboxylate transporter receptor subunit TctC
LIESVVADAAFREKLGTYDFETAWMDGEPYKQTLIRQLAENEKTVKSLNIKFE